MRGDPILRAGEAEMILNHPMFKQAMSEIESEILRQIQDSKFDGSKNAERYREKLNLLLYVQGRYKTILNKTIQAGKIAENAIQKGKVFQRGL